MTKVKYMKRKLLLCSLMLIALVATIGNAKVQAVTTTVGFYPTSVTVSQPGLTTTVKLNVTSVTKLLLWVVEFTWDPTKIQLTTGDTANGFEFPSGSGIYYGIYEGPFFPSSIGLVATGINNTAGYVKGLTCGKIPPGITGSGILAIFNFTAVDIGLTALHINGPTDGHSQLSDQDGASIAHTDIDGAITVVPEFTGPVLTIIFLTITLIAVIITKTKWPKKTHRRSINVK